MYTFKLAITKVDGDNTKITNSEASFILYRTDASDTTEYAKITGGVISGWSSSSGDASTITTSNGEVTVSGIDDTSGYTYYLKETNAPSGYNLLTDPIVLVINATVEASTSSASGYTVTSINATADGTSLSADASTGVISLSVQNNKGASLAETGGIGTTIFYIIGTVLVLGAAVILVTRRRMCSR